MVLVIIGIIVYTFRDSAGPILEQLEKTTPAVIAGICAMTVVYHCVEGVITTLLAKQYNREFTLGMGITNAFLCSFYRVATLGSGAGVAAIVYLGEHGIEYSKSFGMYMLQYAFHKISIAFFSMILFTLNWNYMRVHFGEYMWLLLAGYLITLIITVVLILFSCSRQFHRMLLWVVDFFNGKMKGRFDPQAAMLHEQCQMLEDASRQLMGKKRLVAGAVGLNLIKFAFWYSIPYLIFLGQGEITASADHGGHIAFRHAGGSHSVAGGNRLDRVCLYRTFFRYCRNGAGRLRVASVPLRHLCIPVSGGGGCGHHTPHLPQKNGTSQTIAPAVI